MSGQSLSSIDMVSLQDRVRQAIVDYEPRILPDTLSVQALSNDAQANHHNLIGFRITGQLWAQPVPLELMLHTDIDLETGRVEIRDSGR
jgi:type VI secretion system protein ImpF